MIEYEKKILLSPWEYFTLLQLANKHSYSVIQTNYYYDTDDFEFNEKGMTCRIRCKNGKYKATIKNHCKNIDDVSVEKSKTVTNINDIAFFENPKIKLHGCLVTERTIIISNEACTVMLDKNTYLGTTDYELEIEYMPACEEQADSIIQDFVKVLTLSSKMFNKIEFMKKSKNSKNKSQRFFERKFSLAGGEKP